MNETDQDGKDRRHARIDALTGTQRGFLLAFLVGYAPEAADTALDDLEGARLPPALPSGQRAKKSPGQAACEAFWAYMGTGPDGQPPTAAWDWAKSQGAQGAWMAASRAARGATEENDG